MKYHAKYIIDGYEFTLAQEHVKYMVCCRVPILVRPRIYLGLIISYIINCRLGTNRKRGKVHVTVVSTWLITATSRLNKNSGVSVANV